MGVLDPRRPVDELGVIARHISHLQDQIDRLAAPSGTQAFQSVKKLQGLIDDIQAQLDAYIATRYTNAQINARIASTPGAVTVNGDQQVAGNQVVNGSTSITGGTISAAGRATLNGGITSTDVRGRVLTGILKQVWIAADGTIGVT